MQIQAIQMGLLLSALQLYNFLSHHKTEAALAAI